MYQAPVKFNCRVPGTFLQEILFDWMKEFVCIDCIGILRGMARCPKAFLHQLNCREPGSRRIVKPDKRTFYVLLI